MEVPESSVWEGAFRTRDLIIILKPQTKKQYHNLGLFEDSEIKGVKSLAQERTLLKGYLEVIAATLV